MSIDQLHSVEQPITTAERTLDDFLPEARGLFDTSVLAGQHPKFTAATEAWVEQSYRLAVDQNPDGRPVLKSEIAGVLIDELRADQESLALVSLAEMYREYLWVAEAVERQRETVPDQRSTEELESLLLMLRSEARWHL